MSSQHRDPAMTVRPPAEVQAAAREQLDAHGWGVREFVTACLSAVAAKPATLLGLLAEYRPPPKRRGRPPAE